MPTSKFMLQILDKISIPSSDEDDCWKACELLTIFSTKSFHNALLPTLLQDQCIAPKYTKVLSVCCPTLYFVTSARFYGRFTVERMADWILECANIERIQTLQIISNPLISDDDLFYLLSPSLTKEQEENNLKPAIAKLRPRILPFLEKVEVWDCKKNFGRCWIRLMGDLRVRETLVVSCIENLCAAWDCQKSIESSFEDETSSTESSGEENADAEATVREEEEDDDDDEHIPNQPTLALGIAQNRSDRRRRRRRRLPTGYTSMNELDYPIYGAFKNDKVIETIKFCFEKRPYSDKSWQSYLAIFSKAIFDLVSTEVYLDQTIFDFDRDVRWFFDDYFQAFSLHNDNNNKRIAFIPQKNMDLMMEEEKTIRIANSTGMVDPENPAVFTSVTPFAAENNREKSDPYVTLSHCIVLLLALGRRRSSFDNNNNNTNNAAASGEKNDLIKLILQDEYFRQRCLVGYFEDYCRLISQRFQINREASKKGKTCDYGGRTGTFLYYIVVLLEMFETIALQNETFRSLWIQMWIGDLNKRHREALEQQQQQQRQNDETQQLSLLIKRPPFGLNTKSKFQIPWKEMILEFAESLPLTAISSSQTNHRRESNFFFDKLTREIFYRFPRQILEIQTTNEKQETVPLLYETVFGKVLGCKFINHDERFRYADHLCRSMTRRFQMDHQVKNNDNNITNHDTSPSSSLDEPCDLSYDRMTKEEASAFRRDFYKQTRLFERLGLFLFEIMRPDPKGRFKLHPATLLQRCERGGLSSESFLATTLEEDPAIENFQELKDENFVTLVTSVITDMINKILAVLMSEVVFCISRDPDTLYNVIYPQIETLNKITKEKNASTGIMTLAKLFHQQQAPLRLDPKFEGHEIKEDLLFHWNSDFVEQWIEQGDQVDAEDDLDAQSSRTTADDSVELPTTDADELEAIEEFETNHADHRDPFG